MNARFDFPRYYLNTVYWDNRTSLDVILLYLQGRLSLGRHENQFAAHVEQTYKTLRFLGFDSGTSSLIFAFRALKKVRPDRDEVVIPCYVCHRVIQAVTEAQLKPVFCDIGSDLNIDPEALEKCLSAKTLAVVIAHT